MTVADVSAAYKDAIGAFLKCLQNLMRSDCGRTQGSDCPHVRWVLQAAYTRQVSSGVGAPVAQKSDYGRFKLLLGHDFSSIAN